VPASVSVVVVAAGQSNRFNQGALSPVSKLLIEWSGKTLIEHTLEALSSQAWQELVLVAPADQLEDYQNFISQSTFRGRGRVVAGGTRRQDSVRQGLRALQAVDRVFIHDGARPFLEPQFLESLVSFSQEHSAVVPGEPVFETLKEVDENFHVIRTHDRRRFWRIQTPQVFDFKVLLGLHEKYKDAASEFTDDAALFEAEGLPVKVVVGQSGNIKVTVREDLRSRGIHV
jgi:2-C-methyl-D-erythritol 4-phosphate cytidylyltransferase